MAQKPTIPKGTRDFSPVEMGKRNFIFDTIKDVFRRYGFQPIETPAMENLSTLTGKYGEEGDRLLFKVLNSGDFLSKVPENVLHEQNSGKLTPKIAEKGLRYDLTVPFARFVVQNRNEIVFPFRRYQIQPVWRADRPQKGRYREFYQCDADVIGSDSLINEAELIQIIGEVFQRLNIKTDIKINNRKILAGISEVIGEQERLTEITVALDKLDKIGLEKVKQELSEKGVSEEAITKLQPILSIKGDTGNKINRLRTVLKSSETGIKGLDEMETLFGYLDQMGLQEQAEMDLTLARGLDYYTGAIIEVKAAEVELGSICGGGRYDDLTGIFGLPGISGVGISFGAERIYDMMENLDLFPEESPETTRVMFVNFGKKEEAYCFSLLAKLRKKGIHSEIYPENVKMKKQMNYANKKHIPFVVLAGDAEMKAGKFTLKNMETGDQFLVTPEELTKSVSKD